jgi:hypothetical protein
LLWRIKLYFSRDINVICKLIEDNLIGWYLCCQVLCDSALIKFFFFFSFLCSLSSPWYPCYVTQKLGLFFLFILSFNYGPLFFIRSLFFWIFFLISSIFNWFYLVFISNVILILFIVVFLSFFIYFFLSIPSFNILFHFFFFSRFDPYFFNCYFLSIS